MSEKFKAQIASICYRSPVTKINVAVSELPNFTVLPNTPDKRVLPDPAVFVLVTSFGIEARLLQIRLWVPTPQYRAAQRDHREGRFGISRLRAEKEGGSTVVIDEGQVPQIARSGARTPDSS